MYSPLTKSIFFTILLLLTLGTAGCGRQSPHVTDQTLILPSTSIDTNNNYQGHSDGCQSASGHWQKDTKLWKRYIAYRKAWRYGYKTCR